MGGNEEKGDLGERQEMGGSTKSCLKHVKLKIPVRYPSRNVKHNFFMPQSE